MSDNVTNVVLAGLGGQGVLKASDILAEVAFRAGYDVKKAEVHGMSQRGGSVASDVRYGRGILSPMVPLGEADVLVLVDETQLEPNRPTLKPGGLVIRPAQIEAAALPNPRSLNVALLGILAAALGEEAIPASAWEAALQSCFDAKLHEANRKAFALGRSVARP